MAARGVNVHRGFDAVRLQGGHGWGIRDSFRYKAQWQDAVLDWLRRINE